MSKICTSCGAMNSENAVVCSRCGKSLGMAMNNSVNNQYMNNNMNSFNSGSNSAHQYASAKTVKSKKHLFIIIAIVGILVAMTVTFVVIKTSDRAPSEDWLKENIPQELLTYTWNNETCTPSIESLTVERRNTEDDMDDAFCVVHLADEKIERTLYVEIMSVKYDEGGWGLTSWNEYKTEEYKIKEEFVKKLEEQYVEENNYFIKNPQYTFSDNNNKMTVCYDASADYKYLSITGQVTRDYELSFDNETYPHEFSWRGSSYDLSNTYFGWKIDGKWSGKIDDYHHDYDLELEIEELEGDYEFRYSGNIYFDTTTGKRITHSGEGTFYSNEVTDAGEGSMLEADMIEMKVMIYMEHSCMLIFTTDSAKVAGHGGLGQIDEESATELKKKK